MNIVKNINWRIALIILLLGSLSSPYISGKYHVYVGFVPLLSLLTIILFSGPVGNFFLRIIKVNYKNNRYILFALLWFAFGFGLNYLLRGANDRGYLIETFVMPAYFFLGLFIIQLEQYKRFAVLTVIMFIFFNIVLAGESINANTSARLIYSESNHKLLAISTGFWGLIGIFFPIFLLEALKQKKLIFKFGILFILVFSLIKLFFSGIATPILLFLINLFLIGILYFLFNLKNINQLVKSILVILTFVGASYYLYDFIRNSSLPALAPVKWRVTNLINNPEAGGYSGNSAAGSRFILMKFSWDTFIHHPFFGGGGNIRTSIYQGISGGHSSAIDFLAVLGLLGGGGAFLYMMFRIFKRTFLQMKSSKTFTDICHFATVVTFVIGGIMNPYWQGPLLATFLLIVNIYKQPKLRTRKLHEQHSNLTYLP